MTKYELTAKIINDFAVKFMQDYVNKHFPTINWRNIMKKNGIDIDEWSYSEMTKSVGGQSIPQPYHEEPLQNEFERKLKSNFDQSGMKGE